jgi:hypothetical protein
MVIDSSGNVGIGTTSPTFPLEIQADGNANTINNVGRSDNISQITFTSNDKSTDFFDLQIGPTNLNFQGRGNIPMTFKTDLTERMRIDGSGNVVVGQTANFIASSTTATGLSLTQEGRFTLSRSGTPMNVGRLGSDGSLIDFWRQGAAVGSIGTHSNGLTIGSGDSALKFSDGNNDVRPWDVGSNSATDGSMSLGTTAATFNNLYLSGDIKQGGADGTPKNINVPHNNSGGVLTFTFDPERLGNPALMFVNIATYLNKYVHAIIVLDLNAGNSLILDTQASRGLSITASIDATLDNITIEVTGIWGNASNYYGRITSA